MDAFAVDLSTGEIYRLTEGPTSRRPFYLRTIYTVSTVTPGEGYVHLPVRLLGRSL